MAAESSSEPDIQSGKSDGKKRWIPNNVVERRKKFFKAIMKSPEEEKRKRFDEESFVFFDEDLELYNKTVERMKPGDVEPMDDDGFPVRNGYQMVLVMMKHMPDKKKRDGRIICQWLLENFIIWIEKRGDEDEMFKKFVDERLQVKAIHSGFQEHGLGMFLRRIFKVDEPTTLRIVVDSIAKHLEEHNFKDSADLALRYGIVDDYSFEQLALPLILCDKTQVMMELLKASTKMQKAYLKFLDDLVDLRDEDVIEVFRPYKEKNMVKIGLDRFFGKCLIAFIHKFFNGPAKLNNFDLDAARDTPNFDMSTKKRALLYYIRARYDNNEMTDEMYFQHMKSGLAKRDSRLFFAVLLALWKLDQRETKVDAISLVNYFNVPKTDAYLPVAMKWFYAEPDQTMISEANRLLLSRKSEDVVKEEDNLYVVYDEKQYPIRIVRNASEFEELIAVLSAFETASSCVYVGFDCEMRPAHLVEHGGTRTSLIQFFFCEESWIVDCMALEAVEMPLEMWAKFAKCLFDSRNIRVVGFDVMHDVETLRTIGSIREGWPLENITNVVCLKNLIEALFDIDPQIMDLEKKTCRLVNVVQKVLGIVLDKSEQASNWECRPLRKSQIVYAAMDAVVVLEVFKKTLERARRYEGAPIDMEKLLVEASVLTPKREKKHLNTQRKLTMIPWEEIYETLAQHRDPEKPLTRPCDIRIIIDKMIMGVGRNLQLLGFDVLIPSDVNNFYENMVNQMSSDPKERRWLVTMQSKRTDRMRAEYDDSKFISIVDSSNKSPLENVCEIFSMFNIDLRPEDDFYQKFPEKLNVTSSASNESTCEPSKSSASNESTFGPSN